ncbi:hypothetical protein M9Y10_014108 [Tritrichomonas musculus]|uniref:Ras family protein n=1 Tax=Tritrichomonas musculus TaxID=1915356 RepID=A0ABR2KYL8_9EUKA
MCFKNCTNLRKIIIPSSITSLEKQSFQGCTNLCEITIPSSVTSIGESTFQFCENLERIEIPSSVTNIGSFAFENCRKLEEMIVPSSVTSIGDYFVSGCYSLRTIIIPKKLQRLGKINFQNFSSLKEFIIPSCVNCIGDSTFDKCTSLTNVEIPPSVKEIEEKAFFGCTSLKTINIPSAKNIKRYTFGECTSLVEVTISSTVETIANDAFHGCKSLSKITISNPVKSLPKILIESNPLLNKVLLVGASNTGKSSILMRLCENSFKEDITATIGVEFKSKIFNIDGNEVRLQIWDTSGIERFHNISKAYYSKANCFVVIFDLSSLYQFNEVKKHFNEIQDERYPTFQILLGNKGDLEHNVSNEEIRKIEEKYNAKYFEVSAKRNENINEAFEYIAKKLYTSISEETNKLQNLINNNNIAIDGNGKEKKSLIF